MESSELDQHMGAEKWDVFICHAREDKDDIARPLACALDQEGLKVWYDEFTLTLGDSLRRKIDYGLARSRYGAVILSPHFFAKEWPQRELDGFAAREDGGEKVILPIWHKLTRDYIANFSPTLADKVGVATDKGLETVAREILRVVRAGVTTEDFTPTNTPVPTGISVLYRDNGVDVTLTWDYTQGEIPADRFIIFQSRGTPITTADSSTVVAITSRTFICSLPKGRCYRFGIATARGQSIGAIVQPLASPDWEIAT